MDEVLETLMPQILDSLYPFERKIWGPLIRKTARGDHPPRYARKLPRYGPMSAMHLLLSTAWLIPATFVGLAGAFILIGGQASHQPSVELLAVPVFVVSVACYLMAAIRIASAARLSHLPH